MHCMAVLKQRGRLHQSCTYHLTANATTRPYRLTINNLCRHFSQYQCSSVLSYADIRWTYYSHVMWIHFGLSCP